MFFRFSSPYYYYLMSFWEHEDNSYFPENRESKINLNLTVWAFLCLALMSIVFNYEWVFCFFVNLKQYRVHWKGWRSPEEFSSSILPVSMNVRNCLDWWLIGECSYICGQGHSEAGSPGLWKKVTLAWDSYPASRQNSSRMDYSP